MDNDTAALEDKKLLLEQYKAYLADLQQIGGRLETNRSFMLSILTFLFVILSLGGKDEALLSIASQLTWVILFVALPICIMWFLRIRTYGAKIKAKLTVLQEIEVALPFQCFKREDELFHQHNPIYLITIDRWIPLILMGAFVLLVVTQQI